MLKRSENDSSYNVFMGYSRLQTKSWPNFQMLSLPEVVIENVQKQSCENAQSYLIALFS